MTILAVCAAIALTVLYGRYWALTDRAAFHSRFRLDKRSARAVKAVGSRRREDPVMTAEPSDDPSRPASRAAGREAVPATRETGS